MLLFENPYLYLSEMLPNRTSEMLATIIVLNVDKYNVRNAIKQTNESMAVVNFENLANVIFRISGNHNFQSAGSCSYEQWQLYFSERLTTINVSKLLQLYNSEMLTFMFL